MSYTVTSDGDSDWYMENAVHMGIELCRGAQRPMTTQIRIGFCTCYWWLVRVTLVVDLRFLAQNFGLVVGTYEGLLPFCDVHGVAVLFAGGGDM